ncbi:MAG: holo-ACP synthase [candidate division KSB1 bacterium]|nr:holo-ACP synthase [candidate division KSB1 bacterium]
MLGVGIDIVEVERIRRAVERWGDRFLQRILTEEELRDCRARGQFYHSVAARFAAKEAFVKAIPGDTARSLPWHEFAVRSVASGRPLPELGERARRLVGHHRVYLSLTHAEAYAAAVVIIE